jgi:hypothetical protein
LAEDVAEESGQVEQEVIIAPRFSPDQRRQINEGRGVDNKTLNAIHASQLAAITLARLVPRPKLFAHH